MKVLTLAVLLIVVCSGLGVVVAAESGSLKFKYVTLDFYGDNATIRIVLNESKAISIKFERVYAATDFGHGVFPEAWVGDIGEMSVFKEYGNNSVMGSYIHVRMNTSVMLHSMVGFRSDYPLQLELDFFISSRGYIKHGVNVDNRTIRYDLKMKTDCPADLITLQEEINFKGSNMSIYMPYNHQWKEIKRTTHRVPLNISGKMGEIGIGVGNKMDYRYMWSTDYMNSTLYTYFDGKFDIFFAYINTGSIVVDPYIKMPVPIILGNVPNVVKKAVNYLMEHAISVVVGVAISSVLISLPLLRRRRL